jgi:hypothetical protein
VRRRFDSEDQGSHRVLIFQSVSPASSPRRDKGSLVAIVPSFKRTAHFSLPFAQPADPANGLMSSLFFFFAMVEVDSTAMGPKPAGPERSKYLPRAHGDRADRQDLVLVAALILRPMSDIDAPRFEKGAPSGLFYRLSSVIL